ncbi:protein diaphanous homolog 1-like, partial [Scomber scombrus]
ITEDQVMTLVQREEILKGLTEQEGTYREVMQNITKSQDKVRKQKQERGQETNFTVEDLVLRKNVRQEQTKGGELSSSMLGPLKITRLEGKSADLMDDDGKVAPKINIDHLTHDFKPEERIPAKLKKVVDPSSLADSQTDTPATCPGPSNAEI